MLRVARLSKILADTFRHYRLVKRSYSAGDFKTSEAIVQSWARGMVESVGLKVEVSGAPICQEPCLFVGNHMSYLDIPVFFTQRSGTFVAKVQVKSWPLFGMSAAAAGTIFVDRSSVASYKKVAEEITRTVKEGRRSVIVFPEGTSSIEGKPWKKGVFGIAQENQFPLQAFRISYRPARAAAFIGDDSLAPHLWNLLGCRDVVASLEFLPVQKISDVERDSKMLETQVHESLARHLGKVPGKDI